MPSRLQPERRIFRRGEETNDDKAVAESADANRMSLRVPGIYLLCSGSARIDRVKVGDIWQRCKPGELTAAPHSTFATGFRALHHGIEILASSPSMAVDYTLQAATGDHSLSLTHYFLLTRNARTQCPAGLRGHAMTCGTQRTLPERVSWALGQIILDCRHLT